MKAKANGIQINYRIDGPEGAPWVTMSNSLATTHRMWDAQMEAFTRLYRVLRYDKRGHGETDVAPGPYSFELLADDVLGLLDALQITRTHFVGLSMGGMTGMTVALRRPGVLRSLVLCDTTARIRSAIPRSGSSASTPSTPGAAWSPWSRARWRASSPRPP
jgi:pimeloyl-ACP methyl ester carboxylesterase